MQPVSEMPFVGGDTALDFVNTAEQRGHPEAGEALVTPADLRLWGQRYGLLGPSARLGPGARDELILARRARDLLYDLLTARIDGRPATRAQLAELAGLARAAYQAGSLQAGGGGAVSGDGGGGGSSADSGGSVRWQWNRSDLASVRHVAVTSGIELLGAGRSPRLKQCPGDHCGWIFLDTTKRGNRRWCQMSECGQEAKDVRRRARRHAADPGRNEPGR